MKIYNSYCQLKKGTGLDERNNKQDNKEFIKRYHKCFGFIRYVGRSELIFIENRWSSKEYIRILEQSNIIDHCRNKMFVQDNDSYCSSGKTTSWFEENDVRLIKLPETSSDLKVIEHCWSMMKKKQSEFYIRGNELKQNQVK